MKKIILTFALLLAVLFINSCEDEDAKDADGNSIYGFPRHKAIVEVITDGNETYTRTFNFTYKNNLPNTIKFYYNDINNTTYNYLYNSNRQIEKIIINTIQNAQNSESVVNFYYHNNDINYDINYVESYFNNEIKFYTKYIHIKNQLKEMFALNYENGEVIDSTHYSEFKGARPIYVKHFSKNDKKEMILKKYVKKIYQNGNLKEEYEMNDNSEWQISKRCYFDLTKEDAFYNLREIVTPFTNFKVFNRFDYDRNLIIKEEYYDLECNGTKYNEPTIVEVIEHIGTHNSTNMIEKLKSTTTANCGQKNRFNSEKIFTWD